jgi:hypothetical protein
LSTSSGQIFKKPYAIYLLAMSDQLHQPTSHQTSSLLGVDATIAAIFPDPASRPAKRTFLEWKSRKYFPTVKVGKRVFFDPVKVRASLEKRFTIHEVA